MWVNLDESSFFIKQNFFPQQFICVLVVVRGISKGWWRSFLHILVYLYWHLLSGKQDKWKGCNQYCHPIAAEEEGLFWVTIEVFIHFVLFLIDIFLRKQWYKECGIFFLIKFIDFFSEPSSQYLTRKLYNTKSCLLEGLFTSRKMFPWMADHSWRRAWSSLEFSVTPPEGAWSKPSRRAAQRAATPSDHSALSALNLLPASSEPCVKGWVGDSVWHSRKYFSGSQKLSTHQNPHFCSNIILAILSGWKKKTLC